MINKNVRKNLLVLSLSGVILAACSPDEPVDTVDPTEEEDQVDNGEEVNGVEDPDEDPDEEVDEDEAELSQNLEDWFPPLENVQYSYEGEGMEFAEYEWTPQFIHDDTFQVSEATPATTVVRIYEYREDEIVETFNREETYFREDFVETDYPAPQEEVETILQLPIEEGHNWESETGATYEITDINAEIDTPSDSYEAIEVTRTLDDSQTVDYYAEGVGLVHSVSDPEAEDMEEITSSLAEIEESVPEIIPVALYRLNEDATAIEELSAEFELYTNDPAREALGSAMRGEDSEMQDNPLLTENVEINYMFLDANNIANVDFSEELISEMQAGSGIETMILQSVVNTIGDYYNVEEVLLTVDDEPYATGHIELEEDETLEVDHSEVE